MTNLWKLIPVLISAAILRARAQSLAESIPSDDQHYIVFEKVGEMAAKTTYIHVMMSLNFTHFEEDVLTMNKSMNAVIDKLWQEEPNQKTRKKLKLLQDAVNKRITISAKKVKLMDKILPNASPKRNKREPYSEYPPPPENVTDAFLTMSDPHMKRYRRQIEAATVALGASGIAGAATTFMGIYTAVQINSISNQIQEQSKEINLLVQVTNRQTEELKTLTKYTKDAIEDLQYLIKESPCMIDTDFNDRLIEMEEHTARFVTMVQQLQHRRMAVDWLTVDQLNLLHKHTLQIIKAKNYHPLVKQVSDYYQLEMSYLRKEDGVVAILHVPAMVAPKMMSLYRYVPFPIPLQEGGGDVKSDSRDKTHALFIKTPSDLIALDENNNFKIVSATDFATCTQHSKIFLCKSGEILKTNLLEDCMGSLFMRNKEAVQTNCKFEIKPIKEEIFRLNHHEFMVYSPSPFVTSVICKNKTRTIIDLGKITKLYIPAGCSVELASHIITVEEDFGIYLPSHVSSWDWDLPLDSIHVINNNNQIQSKLNILTKKLQELSFEQEQTPILQPLELDEGWSVQKILYFVGIAAVSLLALVILGCIATKCNKNHSLKIVNVQPPIPPSAPLATATPMPIQMQMTMPPPEYTPMQMQSEMYTFLKQ
jgi:hypothetical protein